MQYFKLIKILLNLSIALFLTLSLSSYNASDTSFNNKTDAAPNNLLGEAGSYIADIIMQLFGLSGFLIILIPLFWAHRIWRVGDLRLCVARLSVSLLTLCAASLLLSYVNVGNAGAMGVLINHSLKQYDRQNIQIIAAFTMLVSFYFAVDLRYDFLRNLFSSILEYLKLLAKFMQRNKKDKSTQKKNNIRIAPSLFKAEVLEDEVKEKKELVADSSIEEVKSIKNKNSTNLDSYILPSTNLLKDFAVNKELLQQNNAAMNKNRQELAQVLSDFGVTGDIIGAYAGPVVTLYELEPSAGTKSSRIIGLSDDIARSMRAIASRIAVIPGRNAIGIELPNKQRETVYLKELLESKEYRNKEYDLPIILGKDIAGNVVIADLARMPHLLVAGTTGSGKSVAINTMILSLVYSLTPEQCRFIMIDPKMLELSIYDNIPHLLTNVVTEPGKAVVALKWVVKEMENRYRLMSNLAVRNIHSYNSRIKEAIKNGEIIQRTVQTGFDVETGQPKIEQVPLDMKLLPFIVVIVDEMADLMLVAGKDIESSIQRLAQMARAAGIHIIMATQRPSVDVITGVIKANFPTRISFQVTSKIDSRTILGEQGAEALLGKGDMLYMAGGSKITRIHGPFVADNEVEKIVSFLKSQGAADYMSDITVDDGSYGGASASMDVGGADDDLYRQAVEIVQQEGKASTSFIQRCLKIGYNRAANIIEQMEKEGLVSKPNHVGKREILM
jgi:DNA segregation ATPase FtsK/SpoIIIE, S-DNA-T family